MEVISQPDSATRRISIASAKSGVGMDRVLARKKLPPRGLAIAAVFAVVFISVGWYLYDQASGRSLVIENSRVVISPVTEGLFEDFIPIRARVTPKKTVFLDIIEGGQVEQRLIDDGAMHALEQILTIAQALSNLGRCW